MNDSGVVGDQDLDSVSEDKLRLHVRQWKSLESNPFIDYSPNCCLTLMVLFHYLIQVPMDDLDAEIINCKDKVNGKRPSNVDNPVVVSMGKHNMIFHYLWAMGLNMTKKLNIR